MLWALVARQDESSDVIMSCYVKSPDLPDVNPGIERVVDIAHLTNIHQSRIVTLTLIIFGDQIHASTPLKHFDFTELIRPWLPVASVSGTTPAKTIQSVVRLYLVPLKTWTSSTQKSGFLQGEVVQLKVYQKGVLSGGREPKSLHALPLLLVPGCGSVTGHVHQDAAGAEVEVVYDSGIFWPFDLTPGDSWGKPF